MSKRSQQGESQALYGEGFKFKSTVGQHNLNTRLKQPLQNSNGEIDREKLERRKEKWKRRMSRDTESHWSDGQWGHHPSEPDSNLNPSEQDSNETSCSNSQAETTCSMLDGDDWGERMKISAQRDLFRSDNDEEIAQCLGIVDQ